MAKWTRCERKSKTAIRLNTKCDSSCRIQSYTMTYTHKESTLTCDVHIMILHAFICLPMQFILFSSAIEVVANCAFWSF